ncbi:S-methyl-5'-thioadenosine phosphorylase [Colletotrichum spaethianum]|uniref:S-methyl-5'-thioadenosine phosphorylase n=1 Tax=Colletotrichum spaethianum TaxID=700344 RepID=A0AA37PCT5_9PEZI|nr:S-methyl-5'-thioadenosine phosphorylase [Colletotrichum spaethianum]GKT49780.1 S-methyl-5'-thioadenosine phosphorylase [Colletotrichum spaethianum]
MESLRSRDSSEPPIDPAHPFKGVVVCCTSIPPDQRTEELGGIHKYDLTPDVTHLVVGDYDTPKYRHVAKERNDIKAMDARWIDIVGELWMKDAEIDFAALEREWQLKPLETCGDVIDTANPTEAKRGTLLLCMTGFDDPEQRASIIEKITANGGAYTGDLTKRVSHLIVFKPEGKKYKAARAWNIRTVSLAWLEQSIERGMILDEQCFDPVLPPEEQGQGAWNKLNPRRVSLGKRSRSGVVEVGQRKLRKTASMKLSSQRDTLWGDILGSKPTGESSGPGDRADKIEVQDSGIHDRMLQPAPDAGIFSACYFFMAGFESWKSKILAETIGSLGGQVCSTFEDFASKGYEASPSRRFLIVPQESQPSTHFQLPPVHADKIQIVTEFFVERCLHNKTLCDPDRHVLGRPFPIFPIRGFEDLSICTAGFSGIDLLHVEKAVRQIGAKFAARLNDATSVLVCRTLTETRKEKLKFAFDNKIPIVNSEWLWECITTGYNVPVKMYMFPALGQADDLQPKSRRAEQYREDMKQAFQRTRSEPIPHIPKRPTARHSTVAGGIDTTAFQDDEHQKPAITQKPTPAIGEDSIAPFVEPERDFAKGDSTASLQFQTAKTHQMDSFGAGTVVPPLSDATLNALNKSPTAERMAKPSKTLVRTTSVADSMEPTPLPVEEESAPVEDEGEPVPAAGESQVDTRPKDDEEAELKRQRDAQKAAEKEALTSKLASLIDFKRSAESVPEEENSGQHQHQQPRRPRKRPFGRAVSNASAASSGSTESRMDSMARTADEYQPQQQQQQQDAEQQPPSTQIQYQDPGAQQHRDKIISKMRGEDSKPPAITQPTKKKVTTIGGFDFSEEGRPTTRQLRRK